MTSDLFSEYLFLSDKMRTGYKSSLGKSHSSWENFFTEITPAIPEVFLAIYGEVAGTHRDIAIQKYMDFVPGYRLIQITDDNKEVIFHFAPGDGLQKWHNSEIGRAHV